MCSISHSIITQYANVFQTLERYYLILVKCITSTCRPGFKRTHTWTHTHLIAGTTRRDKQINKRYLHQSRTHNYRRCLRRRWHLKRFLKISAQMGIQSLTVKDFDKVQLTLQSNSEQFLFCFFLYHRFTPSLWNLTSWSFHSFTHFGFRYM